MKTLRASPILTTLLIVCFFLGAARAFAQTNSDPVWIYDNHLSETFSAASTVKAKVSGWTIIDRAYQRSIQFMVYPGRSTLFTVRTNTGLYSRTIGPVGSADLCIVQANSPRAGVAATFSAKGKVSSITINASTVLGAKDFSWSGTDIGADGVEQWTGTLSLDALQTNNSAQQSDTVDSAAARFWQDLVNTGATYEYDVLLL